MVTKMKSLRPIKRASGRRKKLRKPELSLGLKSKIKSLNPESEQVKNIAARICGDDAVKLTKQHLALKQQFPRITLPESIVYVILKSLRVDFIYQADAFGGRVIQGGQVPDFMIPDLQMVLRIQGDYWHSRRAQREKDLLDRIALLSAEIQGRPIQFVIDIWESRVLDCSRKKVVQMALRGQEVGK